MTEITKSDIAENQFLSILSEGIHGGIIPESTLNEDEIDFCKSKRWIHPAVRFRCPACGTHHEVRKGSIICTSRQIGVEVPKSERTIGYRFDSGYHLSGLPDSPYSLRICESRAYIEPNTVESKTIFFTPDSDDIELYEPSGRIVVGPLSKIEEAYTGSIESIIDEVRGLLQKVIDWEKLDSSGDEFAEITYRILEREDDFHDVSPGGAGPDQGKDGFCYLSHGRRNLKILVQAKFNNNSSGINVDDYSKMATNATGMDCKGVLLTAVSTTGDLETKLGNDSFLSQLHFVDAWNGKIMKEKITKYPGLISEYFLN